MNPFKKGCKQYIDFETMSDCQWHCSKCELVSGQAKTWQVWRQEKGIQLDQDEYGNWYKRMRCPQCQATTYHRKLKTTEINTVGIRARSNIHPSVIKRAKELYGFVDEYSLRVEPANKLQLDHRVPQVRWETSEESNVGLTDEQIEAKFMLLTEANNLLKSRCCEECKRTGIRAKGYRDIEYWYVGSNVYDAAIGCEGCFWYNPSKWRLELNKDLKR